MNPPTPQELRQLADYFHEHHPDRADRDKALEMILRSLAHLQVQVAELTQRPPQPEYPSANATSPRGPGWIGDEE
jgi:hypothetical protein